MSRRTLVVAVAAAAVVALLLGTDLWPGLRGPENWRWARRVFLSPWLLASGALFGTTVALRGRLARGPLGAMAAAALIFLQMVVLTAAEPEGLRRVAERVESPSFTSYDTIARGVDDPREFLRRYPRIQDRFPVHGPSQPPGRVLYFWTMRRLLGDAAPAPAGFLLMAFGALTVIPLMTLVSGRGANAPARRAAVVALMATLPSFVLFTPQTDHLVLLLSVGAAALLVTAVRRAADPDGAGARVLVPAFAAGLAAGTGAFLSFTTLAALTAWGLAVLGMLLLRARAGRGVPFPSLAGPSVAALAGAVVVVGSIAGLGLDWVAVFGKCTEAAHRVQVLVHGREYSTWVFWNLADFALFTGIALVIAAASRTRAEWSAAESEIPFATALLVSVAGLDVSGRILGETGRIWMFLMPLAVGAAACTPRLPAVPLAAAQFLTVLAVRAFLNVPG